MPALSVHDLELNELKWWSKWASVRHLGKGAYMLTSEKLQEPFFNRACFAGCLSASTNWRKAEEEFRRLGLRPTLTVFRDCSAVSKLVEHGYSRSEAMTVMTSSGGSALTGNEEAKVRQVSKGGADEWTRAYLASFYGEETLSPVVIGLLRPLLSDPTVTLLEARMKGSVAGVLAICRSSRLAGIYCVGTVPKFRRMGIAEALLGRTSEVASSEGRRMVLQTLKSDGAERFYSKRGFSALYQKVFMERER